jgi:hypothetical protein
MPKAEFEELSIFYDHSQKLKGLLMPETIVECDEFESDESGFELIDEEQKKR